MRSDSALESRPTPGFAAARLLAKCLFTRPHRPDRLKLKEDPLVKLHVRFLVTVLVITIPGATAREARSAVRIPAPSPRSEVVGTPWVGEPGVTRSVASIMEAAKRLHAVR